MRYGILEWCLRRETRAGSGEAGLGSPRTPSIGDLAEGRENNYDFLRFVAASMVILSHAYVLSGSYGHLEPLTLLTHRQFSLGSLAVKVFFVMSGFLVTASFVRSGSVVKFARARFLRIFPGLAWAVIVTAFVFGPLGTSLPLGAYYTNPHTYLFLETMTLRGHSDLPGVFDSNPLSGVVNGSLWTLTPEVWCCIVVAAMGLGRLLRKWSIAVLFVSLLLAPIVNSLIALPITLLFALISWHLVEKRFMRLKHTGISSLIARLRRG